MRRRDEARSSFDEAVGLLREILREGSPDAPLPLARALAGRALASSDEPARRQDARRGFDEAVKILPQLRRSHPDVPRNRLALAQALDGRGVLRLTQGDLAGAGEDLGEALKLLEGFSATFPEIPPGEVSGLRGRILGDLGRRALAARDPEEARRLLDLAVGEQLTAVDSYPRSRQDLDLLDAHRAQLEREGDAWSRPAGPLMAARPSLADPRPARRTGQRDGQPRAGITGPHTFWSQ